jgi:hypothetical protein
MVNTITTYVMHLSTKKIYNSLIEEKKREKNEKYLPFSFYSYF